MRRCVIGLAGAVVLAGCGGGDQVARYDDVKPCLKRLALVVAKPVADSGSARPEWSVDLAFRRAGDGANAAHLSFYAHQGDARADVRLGREQATNPRLNANFRHMLAQSRVVGGATVVTWSSEPTSPQRRRLAACFD
jgi:hypothetical protein